MRIPVATMDGAPPPWVARVPLLCGLVTIPIAVLVLVGWAFDVPILTSFGGPDECPVGSAIVVLLAGIGLVITPEPAGPRTRAGTVLVAAITLAGALMAVQALTDWVADDGNSLFPTLPNSIVILLAGLSQLGPGTTRAERLRAVALTLFVALGFGFTLVAIYRAHDLADLDGGTRPSIPGAIAFAMAAVGICAARSGHAPISWIWATDVTGAFSRRLFPTAVFLPMGMAALAYLGFAADWYSLPFAFTLLTVMLTTTMIGVVAVTASVIHRGELRIRRATDRFQTLLDTAPYAMLIVDRAGVIRYGNPPIELLLGHLPTELVGQEVEVLIPVLERSGHAALRIDFVAPPEGGPGGHPPDLHALHRDGRHVPIEISLSQVAFAEGLSTVVTMRDVSEKRAAEAALRAANARYRTLAEHDELTGLPNRRRFEAELERHFATYPIRRGALLFIDLDHFKEVNDTLGHRAGDELLRRVAHQMLRQVPGDSVLARQGGDEFLVLVPQGGAEEARVVGKQVQDAVREVSADFEGGAFDVSASIGIVTFDQMPTVDAPSTAALICADIALYSAKNAGRDQIAVFEEV